MPKQTETLLVMNAKLGSLVTDAKAPEKDALWPRKQAAAKQRASLVEQMRALKTEEENISSFDEGSNFMVPGKPEDQGSGSINPADAEYWSDSVLQDAAMMLVKGDSEQVFLANRDRGGLPLAALNVGSSRLIVMYDTGCSPSGLIMRKKLPRLSPTEAPPESHPWKCADTGTHLWTSVGGTPAQAKRGGKAARPLEHADHSL